MNLPLRARATPDALFAEAVEFIQSVRPALRTDWIARLTALDPQQGARERFWHNAHLVAALRGEIDAAPAGCQSFTSRLGQRAAEAAAEAIEELRRRPAFVAALAVPEPMGRLSRAPQRAA